MEKPLAEAEAKLRRFQDAVAAGIEPVALVDAINQAQGPTGKPHEPIWPAHSRPMR
ncbi:hypothetical protein GCM10023321_47130 [Pseudonocardia eucalypti]|uniref:Antitoxin VbhA domain-containing protein n=1 Tax=Pseudonocardia eucalypti TaxID=648755 RepID=A0ABP9QHN6_9PSEU|nr:hypothetical protein [Pseudonocardia eucalypti]